MAIPNPHPLVFASWFAQPMRHWLCLLTALSSLTYSQATVDPRNTRYFIIDENTDLPISFNITHTYHRQRILAHRLYNFDGRKCVPLKRDAALPYWIDENALPAKMRRYNASNESDDIDDSKQIYAFIAATVAQVFNEMQIIVRQLPSYAEYNYLINRQLYPDKNISHPYTLSSYFLPLRIHFQKAPYPQSGFLEFVSNRDRRWEIYDESIYPLHAGNDDDLRYRLRHNLRHSLGLGHTTYRRCIMFPTNIRSLYRACKQEISALHHLLCRRQLTLRSYTSH